MHQKAAFGLLFLLRLLRWLERCYNKNLAGKAGAYPAKGENHYEDH